VSRDWYLPRSALGLLTTYRLPTMVDCSQGTNYNLEPMILPSTAVDAEIDGPHSMPCSYDHTITLALCADNTLSMISDRITI